MFTFTLYCDKLVGKMVALNNVTNDYKEKRI